MRQYNSNKVKFVASGDSFITRRLSNKNYDNKLGTIIKSADFRFTNLEITLRQNEGYPSALSGGTWATANPAVLNDLLKYGFNCMNWANNHTLDYLYEGLIATEENLDAADIVHAGAGENLASASSPRYLETDNGSVALIGVTSTFHDFWRAGNQRTDMKGRPGINPLRFDTTYVVRPEYMSFLMEIGDSTYINSEYNLAIKEGFTKDDGIYKFGGYSFVIGEEEQMIRKPYEEDMRRIIKAIKEAERQADNVIVSIHCHEMNKNRKDEAPDFLEEFAHRCIDEGAHAIIGHGPHIIRGVEIYKKRPIFYSLGNFIFQNESVEVLPSDFYEKYQLPMSATVADALDKRSDNNTKGLGVNKAVWKSIIPYWEMEDGELTYLKFYPIELGWGLKRFQRGWPKLSNTNDVLFDLEKLSRKYNTKFKISGASAEAIL